MGKSDGVVIFFDSKRFELIRRYYLNTFVEGGMNYPFKDIFAKEMYYPSMALFLVMRRLDGPDKGKDILVVNTHLLFNKNRGHVKLGMIVLVLKTIEAIKKQHELTNVFVCGDFNLIPNSMLYEYISNGEIDLECGLKQYSNQVYIMNQMKGKSIIDVVKLADQKFKPFNAFKDDPADKEFLAILAHLQIQLPKDQEEEITMSRQANLPKLSIEDLQQLYKTFSLSAKLKSSYACFHNVYMNKHRNQPEFKELNFAFDPKINNNDNFISQFAQDMVIPVDYIWYSMEGAYEPVKILQTPDPFYLGQLSVTCPVDNFGSDHFSIATDFKSK